jgi:triosephosphate isomerase
MKKILIAGNWKMNLNTSEASSLVHRLSERIRIIRDVEVVIAPSALQLQPISMQIDRRKFRLAAQNAYHVDEGQFTGEISFSMLRDIVHYVIIGHSDRRHKFGETLEDVRDKMAASIRNEITPILCVGETQQERDQGETMQVIHDQTTTALSNLTSHDIENIVIAYEPVWALSNGKNFTNHEVPTPEIVSKAVKAIRRNIRHLYGARVAEKVRVLYGGSTSKSNAKRFLSTEGVDGLLIGGASLNYEEFSGIIEVANHLNHERRN